MLWNKLHFANQLRDLGAKRRFNFQQKGFGDYYIHKSKKDGADDSQPVDTPAQEIIESRPSSLLFFIIGRTSNVPDILQLIPERG